MRKTGNRRLLRPRDGHGFVLELLTFYQEIQKTVVVSSRTLSDVFLLLGGSDG